MDDEFHRDEKMIKKILNYKIIFISLIFSSFVTSQTNTIETTPDEPNVIPVSTASPSFAPPEPNPISPTPSPVSPTVPVAPMPAPDTPPSPISTVPSTAPSTSTPMIPPPDPISTLPSSPTSTPLTPSHSNNITPATKSTVSKTLKKSSTSLFSDIFKFNWLNQVGFSIQGAGTLNIDREKAPKLIQKSVNKSFLRNFLFFNVQYYFLQFPSFLRWSVKASTGLTRNYDTQSTKFIPLSISGVLHIRIINAVVPFIEWGYSLWNIDFSEFSSTFSYWGTGINISFSLFKPSLKYTLPDEYKINDMGIIVESRWSNYKEHSFLDTVHGGLYLRF